jgi:hypothetical protein
MDYHQRALAPDPSICCKSNPVERLLPSFSQSRITRVLIQFILLHRYPSPEYCEERLQRFSLEPRKRYGRLHSLVLIAAPTMSLPQFTMFPKEVLERPCPPSRRDLVSASSACRAWRPVAQLLLHSRLAIGR